jgi:hypothetical protein
MGVRPHRPGIAREHRMPPAQGTRSRSSATSLPRGRDRLSFWTYYGGAELERAARTADERGGAKRRSPIREDANVHDEVGLEAVLLLVDARSGARSSLPRVCRGHRRSEDHLIEPKGAP